MPLPKIRPPTHPGEMLAKEFLEPLGVSQSEFSRRLGLTTPRAVNELCNRKRAVSSEMALKLEQATGMDAQFWLGLQMDWDLWHAKQRSSRLHLDRIQPLASAA